MGIMFAVVAALLPAAGVGIQPAKQAFYNQNGEHASQRRRPPGDADRKIQRQQKPRHHGGQIADGLADAWRFLYGNGLCDKTHYARRAVSLRYCAGASHRYIQSVRPEC